MDEILMVLLQDMRQSLEFEGKGYQEICDFMAQNVAISSGAGFLPDTFAKLKAFDFSALAAFHNDDHAMLADGRAAFVAVGACLGDDIPEGTAVVLDDRDPVEPGDLCAFSHRCEFYRSVKQYVGRWNDSYGMLAPHRPQVPGYLFYASNPRCFVLVYGEDLVAATRVSSIIKPDGREVPCAPWSMIDHRGDADFADLFTWASVDRFTKIESTPLSEWSTIREENKRALAEWLWSRMNREEQEQVVRIYEGRRQQEARL